jgi:hypothetical protein
VLDAECAFPEGSMHQASMSPSGCCDLECVEQRADGTAARMVIR